MDGNNDIWIDRQTDGWIHTARQIYRYRQMDGYIDRQTDRQTDR